MEFFRVHSPQQIEADASQFCHGEWLHDLNGGIRMNVSLFTQTPCSNFNQSPNTLPFWGSQSVNTGYAFSGKGYKQAVFPNFQGFQAAQSDDSLSRKTQERKKLLRALEHSQDENGNSLFGTLSDQAGAYFETSKASDRNEDALLQKKYNYNYKEVSNKILRAKTPVSAGQAVIAAKRKVVEVKRKIASGEGDSEDLQLALTHAQRMEMVARKKKHHLEQEETAAAIQKRDEQQEKLEEKADDMNNAVVEAAEKEITEQEDAVLEERKRLHDRVAERQERIQSEAADERMEDWNRMISEFGEEGLKELEETMEILENMEILNPHMSKEELEEVKRKHRDAENRAIVKADMDYLKESIKHTVEKGASIPGMGGGSVPSSVLFAGTATPAPSVTMSSVPSIDVQV